MATNLPYSQKVLNCRSRACAKCGYCRDWYWSPHDSTKSYTKRPDATCTASYSYGLLGYGPGCGGCCLCCLAHLPFGKLCSLRYYGGDGYGHGGGIPLSGFLHGGLNKNIDTLAGVDLAARGRNNEAADVADLFGGGFIAKFTATCVDLTDGTLNARIALARAHHDDGRLCECIDNQK
jgi:hypothetical protein